MSKEKYTWDDVIINPKSKKAEDAVGSKVYYSNNPSCCIKFADEDNEMFLGTLKSVEPNNESGHFYIKEKGSCYDCIIVKKEPSFAERSNQWIEENNIKVGDYVKVTRKAENHENGWDSVWVDSMNKSIGKTMVIRGIMDVWGNICLEDDYYYPYFILEKIESKYVPFSNKDDFIEAFHDHHNSKCSDISNTLLYYGMWIRCKESGTLFLVTVIEEEGLYTEHSSCVVPWKSLLNEYEFLDGASCGREIIND